MQNLIYILPVALFAILLLSIIVVSIVLSGAEQKKVKKLVEDIANESPFRKRDTHLIRPHNDPPARNKVYEKRRQEELETNVTLYDPHNLKAPVQQESVQIVGLAEPKGFWSRFIMSQKLSFIMARLHSQNSSKNSGFWTNLIKAQAASQGKEQGRGR